MCIHSQRKKKEHDWDKWKELDSDLIDYDVKMNTKRMRKRKQSTIGGDPRAMPLFRNTGRVWFLKMSVETSMIFRNTPEKR